MQEYVPKDYNHRFDKYLEEYYKLNHEGVTKLQQLSDKILASFGRISDKDYMDFYSIANVVFWQIIESDVFDESQCSFYTYLKACLWKKFYTEYRRKTRIHKEKANANAVSLDAPLVEDGESTLYDMIITEGVIEDEVVDFLISDKTKKFFSGLTKTQKEIVILRTEGYSRDEIRKKLGINEYQYELNWAGIMTYENLKNLFTYQ